MPTLQINQEIELHQIGKERLTLQKALVYSISDQSVILENYPPETEFQFESGMKVTVRFTRPDALYEFDSQVVEKLKTPKLLLVIKRADEDIKRGQRRRFFRVQARIRISTLIPDVKNGKETEFAEHSFTKNLSGSGLAFTLAHELQIGQSLPFELHLPDDEAPIIVKGTIVRKEISEDDNQLFLYGVNFDNIQHTDRSRIILYLNKIQARLKKLDE